MQSTTGVNDVWDGQLGDLYEGFKGLRSGGLV
jgi:hypothetical protein